MKCCKKCKQEKQLSDFSPDKNNKSGIRAICKKCNAASALQYYNEKVKGNVSEEQQSKWNEQARNRHQINLEVTRQKLRDKSNRVRAERIVLLNKIKLEKGCADCGYKAHPSVLHFDHIDPKEKEFTIAKSLCYSMEKIMREIQKCEIRCANCHIIRSIKLKHLGMPRLSLNQRLLDAGLAVPFMKDHDR